MKKISIIIPMYNAEKYIKECLDSIFNEIDENIEVIVVNDGSTDDSINICKMYKNIKLINQDNLGVSRARNVGIRNANGKYVLFLDADDILLKDWKNNLINIINTDKDMYIVSKKYKTDIIEKQDLIKSLFVKNDNYYEYIAAPWSKLYKRSFILSNNIFFDENIINGEDLLFNLKSIILADSIISINQSFYIYRISMVSSTKKFNNLIFLSDRKFYSILDEWLTCENTNFKKIQIDYLKNYTLKNNIYLIALRLTFSKFYSIFKLNSNNFSYYFSKITSNTNIGLLQGIIVLLIKIKFYFLAYLLLRFKIYCMQKGNEELIEI